MDVRYDLGNGVSCSQLAFGCIFKFKRAPKTSLMALVGPEGQSGTFSSSNKPQSRKNKILPIFVCYSPWIFFLRDKQSHFQVQTSPKAGKTRFFQFSYISPRIFGDRIFSWVSVMTLLMALVGPEKQTDAFLSSNDLQSRKI
ncbi:hypothetical protein H5410_056090 [Solanum commersonii]|uniref:Uncharacterized protein n=1 Tax=Solanum commersonii TaxID=4109 RepID=A0A9J5WL92_SOLCO|nr:hypothetical protein H5410_056090 [Solanum commersonii]